MKRILTIAMLVCGTSAGCRHCRDERPCCSYRYEVPATSAKSLAPWPVVAPASRPAGKRLLP